MNQPVPIEQIDDLNFLGGIFQDVETRFADADYESTLKTLEPDFIGTHAEFFSSRSDPNGEPWQPLAKFTVAKKGHDQPLIETDAMRQSLLNPEHQDHVGGFTHRGLLFGTSDEKAIFHQHGTAKIPARPFVGMTKELLDRSVDAVVDHAVESLKFKP